MARSGEAARPRRRCSVGPWNCQHAGRSATTTGSRRELVWEVGPVLVEACGIGPGQRVLDVAAGTGNMAIRAAEAGREVVASRPHARELRGGPPRGRGARASSSSGSRPTPRRSRSATASSTSSPPRSARSSPRTTRRWPTSCSASAAPAARSGWLNFTPEGLPPATSSARSARHAPAARRPSRRCCGAARSTCGRCSATRRSCSDAGTTSRAVPGGPAGYAALLHARRSGRWSRYARPRSPTPARARPRPARVRRARERGPARRPVRVSPYEYLLVVARLMAP